MRSHVERDERQRLQQHAEQLRIESRVEAADAMPKVGRLAEPSDESGRVGGEEKKQAGRTKSERNGRRMRASDATASRRRARPSRG